MPPTRTRSSSARSSGVVLPIVLGGVALYVLGLGLFALRHYDGPVARPRAARVMRDFHAFLGVGPAQARADAPEVLSAPPPPRPRAIRAPSPPAPAVYVPSPLERVALTIQRITREAPKLRQRDRDATFEAARIEVLSDLCDARDVLNEILDERPSHDRANRLWDRLQELLVAVRKL